MTSARLGALISALVVGAISSACNRPQQPAVAPAARTQPPAIIPAPVRPPPTFERDYYARLDDCVHDWGNAQKCTPAPPGSPPSQSGATFLGPIYAKNYREETQVQLRKEAVDGGYSQRLITEASDRSIGKTEVKP